ncbi:hypothetical protein A2U01_0083434, partial [Trifolium medium]|nr:hypothetical protein [Trifolium medium]
NLHGLGASVSRVNHSALKATSLNEALLPLEEPLTVRFAGEKRLCSKEKIVFYGNGSDGATVARWRWTGGCYYW